MRGGEKVRERRQRFACLVHDREAGIDSIHLGIPPKGRRPPSFSRDGNHLHASKAPPACRELLSLP